jgi:hypothetical protein
VEKRTRDEEAARMKEQQEIDRMAAEEWSRDEEAAKMKERQEEERVIAEQRVRDEEAARMNLGYIFPTLDGRQRVLLEG